MATRWDVRSFAAPLQMPSWRSATDPTPITLPSINSKGVRLETSTSMIRLLFSSTTDPMTCVPYSSSAMYNRNDMT